MRRDELLAQLQTLMGQLRYEIVSARSMRKTDSLVTAESVVIPLLREVYDLPNLVNVNATEHHNYPAIDLADDHQREAVQVTAKVTTEKIEGTIEKFFGHDLDSKYDRLLFLSLTEKQGSYLTDRIDEQVPPEFDFQVGRDVVDLNDLERFASSKLSPNSLNRVVEGLKEELGISGQKRPLRTFQKSSSTTCRTSLAHLPSTGSKLFGREQRLADLDDAWKESQIGVATLVAPGGVGKSALVNGWLSRMQENNYRGADLAYGWSFHSQGAAPNKQISADDFVADALGWFGDPNPASGSPWEKGRRLAELVRQQQTILVLDGIEPLQYPPGEMRGWLKNASLQALLKELSYHHPGLCIVTTRLQIEDLNQHAGSSLKRIDLGNLHHGNAGEKLLVSLGVVGSPQELKEASEEFSHNALALTLLGTYLATVHNGDVRRRDRIPNLTEEPKKGGHARRIMRSYEQWMQSKPELEVLYLMGLFEGPIEINVFEVLLGEPPIPGLTSQVSQLSEAERRYALDGLFDLRLLSDSPYTPFSPSIIDCHPLVREYFAERLRERQPEGWMEAHKRLYLFYESLPEEKYPSTLKELEPLYAAVRHACEAGHYQSAFEMYRVRIRRDTEAYSVRKLGAFESDVAAIANFFEGSSWERPVPQISEGNRALLLNWVGFRLRALGRLQEAIPPMKQSLSMNSRRDDWEEVTKDAINLCEFTLLSESVKSSIEHGKAGLRAFDQIGETQEIEKWFLHIALLGTVANAFAQGNLLDEALPLFQKAEEIHASRNPDSPLLGYLCGFFYCDLLLDQNETEEVKRRAKQLMRRDQGRLLDKALHRLSLGKSYNVEEEGSEEAEQYLNRAVEGLRESGYRDYLVRGLLARGSYLRKREDYLLASKDFQEAKEIAGRGKMKLFLADYYLEKAHLHHMQNRSAEAASVVEEAKHLMEDMGYVRRMEEVETLENEIG